MTDARSPEQVAKDLLRECCRRALEHLAAPDPDVSTVAAQLSQTAALVLTPAPVAAGGTDDGE